MYRLSRILLMIISIVILFSACIMFGFTQVRLPLAVYLTVCLLCLLTLDYAARTMGMER